MGEHTTIAWCDHTVNFWHGCTKVGPGCDRCYAEARDKRFHAGIHWGVGAPRVDRVVKATEEARKLNLKAKAAGVRRRVFVNSLSDFFDNEVSDDWRTFALGAMRACDSLDFLIPTKRIGYAKPYLQRLACWSRSSLPANVWLGITVVNQEEADRDIPKLLEVNAAVRFLSIEPQIGRVDLAETFGMWWNQTKDCWESVNERFNIGRGRGGIDWVICGGESGHGARPFDLEWARVLIRECAAAGVPFFMKQLGAAPFYRNGPPLFGTTHPSSRDRAGAYMADWPEDLRVQEFPA